MIRKRCFSRVMVQNLCVFKCELNDRWNVHICCFMRRMRWNRYRRENPNRFHCCLLRKGSGTCSSKWSSFRSKTPLKTEFSARNSWKARALFRSVDFFWLSPLPFSYFFHDSNPSTPRSTIIQLRALYQRNFPILQIIRFFLLLDDSSKTLESSVRLLDLGLFVLAANDFAAWSRVELLFVSTGHCS